MKRLPGGKITACNGLTVDTDSAMYQLTHASLKSASAEALRRELWIIASAGDQVHRNYPLSSDDLTRLHEATSFVLQVLEQLREPNQGHTKRK